MYRNINSSKLKYQSSELLTTINMNNNNLLSNQINNSLCNSSRIYPQQSLNFNSPKISNIKNNSILNNKSNSRNDNKTEELFSFVSNTREKKNYSLDNLKHNEDKSIKKKVNFNKNALGNTSTLGKIKKKNLGENDNNNNNESFISNLQQNNEEKLIILLEEKEYEIKSWKDKCKHLEEHFNHPKQNFNEEKNLNDSDVLFEKHEDKKKERDKKKGKLNTDNSVKNSYGELSLILQDSEKIDMKKFLQSVNLNNKDSDNKDNNFKIKESQFNVIIEQMEKFKEEVNFFIILSIF